MLAAVPGGALLFGLMLLAAFIGGHAAHFAHLPRIIGFLLAGMVLRAVLGTLSEGATSDVHPLEEAARPLRVVGDLALGMILFTLGSVFERSRLRAGAARVLPISAAECGLVFVTVLLGTGVVLLATRAAPGLGANLAIALLLALAAIETAPAATLFVLREYDAKGPITNTVLGLVGFGNVACIVLFHAAFLLLVRFGVIAGAAAVGQHLWLGLAWIMLGSVLVGVVCGTLMSVAHGKLPLAETSLVFFAVLLVLGAGEDWLLDRLGMSYNFLLAALTMGAVFHNAAMDPGKLQEVLRPLAEPIFAGFFVLAGYNLHLDEVVRLGALGAAYVVCRTLGKVAGARIGIARSGQSERLGHRLGGALLCQASVALGLVAFVQRSWPDEAGRKFATVLLGSVAVFELVGPMLLKRCVVQGGEVKVITLLRRAGPATGGASVARMTLRALLGLVGLHRRDLAAPAGELCVRHIMRRNVHFLPASATLDEVLRFVERSTYSHFPVVREGGDFAGMIHFHDVRDVIYEPSIRELVTAVDLADVNTPLVPVDMRLEELLEVFHRHNVAVLPVTERRDDRHLVGIVEQRDLLLALHLRLGQTDQPTGDGR